MRFRRFLPAIALLAALAAPAACGTSNGKIVPADQSAAGNDSSRGPLGNRLTVDEHVRLNGLGAPVDIVRDSLGVVHIYASTPADAFRAQGWAMARDRAVQLEVLRRTALGRLAEVFGDDPSTIDQDIAMRALGLDRASAASYAALAPRGEPRLLLDAFADGVSQYFASIRGGVAALPQGVSGLAPSDFSPWSGTDSLAIAALDAAAVSLPIDQELATETLIDGVPAAFPLGSSDPSLAARANVLPDLLRFAPPDAATVIAPSADLPAAAAHAASHPARLAATARALRDALSRVGRFGQVGSNAWAVAPSLSATGDAMLACDPHFALTSPAAPWLVHLEVLAGANGPDPRDIHAAGAAMAGVPGIAYGFNASLAWGAAASYFDTTDLYRETLTADASGVRYLGADVPFTHVSESIAIKGSAPLDFDVLVVPHHGPVLPHIEGHQVVPPDASTDTVSLRWTGATASTDFEGSIALLRAVGVDDARAATKRVETNGLAYVFADRGGHILYSAHARVPVRDDRAFAWNASSATGLLPCRVLPGDGSTEWQGVLDDSALPLAEDPIEGFVATANADPVGGSLDNDPSNDRLPGGSRLYLGCSFDPGFRLDRIRELLRQPGKLLSLDDLSGIQADVRSALGARIAPHLVDALRRALDESAHPGTYPNLTAVATSDRFAAASIDQIAQLMDDWSAVASYRASAGVRLADAQPSADVIDATGARATLLFNAWLMRFAQRALGDEAARIGLVPNLPESLLVRSLLHLLETDPTELASYDANLRDSVLWDDLSTPAPETRDELMVTSMLDAIDWLGAQLGTNRDDWRWGKLHTVRLRALVPALGSFGIPASNDEALPDGFPRPGDLFAVDAAPYELTAPADEASVFHADLGAALRLVVDMTPGGPVANAVIAGGQVADPSSPHFADQTEYWRHDRTHALPFAVDAVLAAAESRVVVSSASSP